MRRGGSLPGPRLPFQPLADAIGTLWDPRPNTEAFFTHDVEWLAHVGAPITVLSELTGVSRKSISRWVSEGVPEAKADRIAVALGKHVCEIWPDEWWAGVGEESA